NTCQMRVYIAFRRLRSRFLLSQLVKRMDGCSEGESAGTLKIMDCPPQSPDLYPIGHIWGELENKLDRSIVHSKESLWLELQKAWGNISDEVLRKYIDTMPERCAAVIAARGGHTKY
uniref:Uncharacterized protein n=1 Tax=Cyprinus carpio TaxID=7962 RepID=A0A8C2KDT2_CYPCA